jgi:hypothetical protein
MSARNESTTDAWKRDNPLATPSLNTFLLNSTQHHNLQHIPRPLEHLCILVEQKTTSGTLSVSCNMEVPLHEYTSGSVILQVADSG